MSAQKHHSYLLGLLIGLIALMSPALAQADFGIKSLKTTALNSDGTPDLQAGSHPFEFNLAFAMNQDGKGTPEGTLHNLIVDLPPGFAGNPRATPLCKTSEFEGQNSLCPANTQVGVAHVSLVGFEAPLIKAIYNLTPPLGVAARLGFSVTSLNAFEEASLDPANNYGVQISDPTFPSIPGTIEVQAVEAVIWGVPADPAHNPQRFCQGAEVTGCPSEIPVVPFLSLPTNCTTAPQTVMEVDSLQEPGIFQREVAFLENEEGNPANLQDCESLAFNPSLTAAPESAAADSPTGLHVGVQIPQSSGTTPVLGELEALDEVQSLRIPEEGEFKLSYEGKSTPFIPHSASASKVQEELEKLSTVGVGNVSVSGGPGGTAPYIITFIGELTHTSAGVKVQFTSPGAGEASLITLVQGRKEGVIGVVELKASPSAAQLKDVSVTLPEGLTVNPSAAAGLGACALTGPEGINLPGSGNKALEAQPAHCPPSSKVGSVEVKTPLLDHAVPGTVYLARQTENPFNSLLALYIALDDPISGIVAKIPGKVEADPLTGQLRASFENNPQLPFEELDFDFSGGPRATLTTPLACGSHATQAALTSWAQPQSPLPRQSSFPISSGCVGNESQAPNAPAFEAGTANPLAGTYSPFVLKLSRENASQHFGALNLTLPPGVSAKLAGVAECSDAQIAAAAARSGLGQGAAELASPSCPASSEVGTVTVGAGSGTPFYVSGHAYLAGPYKGAPLSVVAIVPAVAGPFDLGVSVVRSALYIDETTAQVTAKSDPLPSILHGIPVDVRSLAIHLNRSQFSLNPTSCEAKAVTGEEISTTGAVAKLKNRFQVGGCRGLDFAPKIALRFRGETRRAQHPALSTTITRPEGQANFGKVSVTLPASQFIDQNHIGNPCTRPKFAEGKCPKISELGTVTAYTPLLDKPLKGKVYFRANGGERTLPDIVADLNGQIHFVLVGYVDSLHKKGSEESRVRTTFAQNPDAPVSKVVLNLFGGKRGVLVNSQNLCTTKVPQRAIVKMAGQNGKAHNSQPLIANSCPKKKKSKH